MYNKNDLRHCAVTLLFFATLSACDSSNSPSTEKDVVPDPVTYSCKETYEIVKGCPIEYIGQTGTVTSIGKHTSQLACWENLRVQLSSYAAKLGCKPVDCYGGIDYSCIKRSATIYQPGTIN